MEILDANMRLLDYLDADMSSRLSYFEEKVQEQYTKMAKKRNEVLKNSIIKQLKKKYRCKVTKENFEHKYVGRLSIKMDKEDPYSHMIYLDKKKLVIKFSNRIEVKMGIDKNGRHKAIITIG